MLSYKLFSKNFQAPSPSTPTPKITEFRTHLEHTQNVSTLKNATICNSLSYNFFKSRLQVSICLCFIFLFISCCCFCCCCCLFVYFFFWTGSMQRPTVVCRDKTERVLKEWNWPAWDNYVIVILRQSNCFLAPPAAFKITFITWNTVTFKTIRHLSWRLVSLKNTLRFLTYWALSARV